jgi:hypothetical protein
MIGCRNGQLFIAKGGKLMRLSSRVTESEVREALEESSIRTWGPERTREISSALDKTAQEIVIVMRQKLSPPSEEPEFPAQWIQPKDAG